MKDLVKRSFVSLFSGSFLWYLIYLFYQKTIIVQWSFFDSNFIFYFFLLSAGLFLLIAFGIYPLSIKRNKVILLFLWIWFIIIGNYVLLNDIQEKIFIWDIVKVFWVIITILAPTNILVTSKVKKNITNSKMEVIDA